MGQPFGVLGRIKAESGVPENGERLAKLEQRMNVVEQGVANFRAFHNEVREFITRADERAQMRIEEDEKKQRTDKKRARFHYWLLGILSAIIVAGFSALFTWLISGNHHVVEKHESGVSYSQPQDAGLPQAYVKQ
jgi:hypothetical protein